MSTMMLEARDKNDSKVNKYPNFSKDIFANFLQQLWRYNKFGLPGFRKLCVSVVCS